MIELRDPGGWWLLALAAVLVLALLLRLRRRSAAISTFFLLRRLADRLGVLSRLTRLLRGLSHLALIGALLSCALAAFRPVRRSGAAPLRELVIVDLSPSLGVRDGGRTRAARQRELLDRYLDALQPEDTVFAVAAGPRPLPSPRLAGDRAARAWLREQAWSDAPAGLDAAVELAAGIARRERPDHCVVFTDCADRWERAGLAARMSGLAPSYVTFGEPVENAGIVAFEVRGDPLRPGRFDLYARIASHTPAGDGPPRRLTVRLAANDRERETRARDLAPGESWEILIRSVALDPGRVALRLEPVDRYDADNLAASGIAGQRPIRVTVAGSGNRYLAEALAAHPAVEVRRAGDGAGSSSAGEGVHIFDGLVPPGDLPDRALFVMPDRDLPGLGQASILPPPSRIIGEEDEPLLRGVDVERLLLKGVLSFERVSGFRPVASADGTPLLLLSDDPRRRWAVLAFDPAQTNVVFTASYPVLMANLLRWLTLDAAGERGFLKAGEAVHLPPEARGGRVELPGGERSAVPDGLAGGYFAEAGRAGRYRVASREGRALGEFHLNVVDPDVTAGIAEPAIGRGSAALPAGLARSDLVLDLAPWLLLAGLLLLALENLLRRPFSSGRV